MKFLIGLAIASSAMGTLFAESHSQQTNIVLTVTPSFINELADEARTNNFAIRSAESRIVAARAGEKAIRVWEDPTIRLGVNPARKSFRESDGDLVYGVEQKLPLFGKPDAARKVAESDTRIEQANAEFQFQQLRKEIAQNIFKTAFADRTVAIGKEDFVWLNTMVAVLEQRYEVGTSTQLEILRLQNERSKRAEQLKTDSQMVGHERVNLNRLLNRNMDSPWPILQLPPIAAPIFYNEKLATLALKNEPKLKTMQRQIEQAAAMSDVARRGRYPDFSVGGEVRNYSGNGEFRQGLLTFSFNLPWGNRDKYAADFQREQAKKIAAELDVSDYELAVRNDTHRLIIEIDSFRREALLYRDEIIPRSEIAIQSANAAWESNAGNFREVLDARRMLLDAQLTYARAVSQQFQAMSELVLCCGLGDLEALQIFSSQNQKNAVQPEK